jgi:AcrR family transcriptional regulator
MRSEQLNPRKEPKQRRSKATVEAILEATSRVLKEEGYEKASTNRIAKVAGVSIGSLYQYFPGKEALVLALVQRHSEAMIELLTESATALARAPLHVAIRTYVRAMLDAHAVDPALHQVLVTQVLHLGLDYVHEMEQQARQIVQAFLELKRDEILVADFEVAAFVLVASVEATTHRAVLERPRYLKSKPLEDEICALVLRYLTGHVGPALPAVPPVRCGAAAAQGTAPANV